MNLTCKEREILTYASSGMNYAEIAEIAGISVRTVQNHMMHIFSKTGSKRRFHAISKFLKRDNKVSKISHYRIFQKFPGKCGNSRKIVYFTCRFSRSFTNGRKAA